MKYRPDIDGLRTLAVLPVVLFHFNIPYLTGGYVGVDVFFVISGFLISSILFAELEQGKFSLVAFYERRARRILPALFAVLVTTFVLASVLMIPKDLQAVGESVLATLLFIANFYFWNASGYFASEAELQPLLHMWSLAVEEQFYIFFPVVLWLTFKAPKFVFLGLFWVVTLGSMAISIYGAVYYPTATFYFPVTRAWELLIGAAFARPKLVLPFLEPLNRPKLRAALSLVGLAGVLAPVFMLEKSSVFPGVNSIYPVLGAALVIWTGSKGDTPVAYLLSRRPVVWIGLISYSLYLWHWPIWVFAGNLHEIEREAWLVRLVLLALTFGLAWVSWRYIEAPFRHKATVSRRQVFQYSAAGGVVLAAIGAAMVYAPSTVALQKLTQEQNDLIAFEEYHETQKFPKAACHVGRYSRSPVPAGCPAAAGASDLLIWGDSFAEHLVPGLQELGEAQSLLQVTTGGCPPFLYEKPASGREQCRAFSALAKEAITVLSPQKVIVAARWDYYDGRWNVDLMQEVSASIAFLKEQGVSEIYVLGILPTWKDSFPRVVLRQSRSETLKETISFDVAFYDAARNAEIEALATSLGATFVSLKDARCPMGQCPVFASNGEVLQWDYGHLTIGGSIDVMRQTFDVMRLAGL